MQTEPQSLPGRRTPLGWRAGAGIGAVVVLLACSAAAAAVVPRVLAQAARAKEVEARLHALESRERSLGDDVNRLESRAEAFDGARAFARAVALGIPEAVARERPQMRLALLRRLSVALVREGERNGLDPLLLTALARVESRFDPQARSRAGARGLFQVVSRTGRMLMEDRGETMQSEDELFDIETSVALGAAYLASLRESHGSMEVALVAYNRGPEAARTALQGPERARVLGGYPRAVLAERDRLARAAAARPAVQGTATQADAGADLDRMRARQESTRPPRRAGNTPRGGAPL